MMAGEPACARSSGSCQVAVFAPARASWLFEMDVSRLQDRLYWGLNRAANVLGHPTDAYRPTGMLNPVDRSNRFLRLPAAFSRADGNFSQPVGYGVAIWRGHFDASYTIVGDYLVQATNTWFIAAQQSLLPVLCVLTNRIVSISRLGTPAMVDSSGSVAQDSAMSILSNWPASMLGTGVDGKPSAQLPGDTTTPSCVVLLPAVHGQVLQPADVITDEYGTRGLIVSAELTSLGWRLNVRQAST